MTRKLVEIIWKDPSFNEAEKMMEYPFDGFEDLLTEYHAYGLFVKEDEKCVIVQHLANLAGQRKFSVIPKSIIKEMIFYYQKSKRKSNDSL